jgi:signal transduction histidine kinase/HAMP domain-containing protein
MLSRIRVPYKLLAIFLLDMVTVVFLVYVVVSESRISIDFARRERLGVAYLLPVQEALLALVDRPLQATGPSPMKIVEALDRLRQVDAVQGIVLETAPVSGAAIDAVAAAASAPAPGNDRTTQAIATLRQLIRRVGDASNLILDPQLDSYYAMSVFLLRMPELLATIHDVDSVIAPLGGAFLSPVQEAQIIGLNARLGDDIRDLRADLQAGYRGNPDGSLHAALDPVFATLLVRLEATRGDLSRIVATATVSGADRARVVRGLNATDEVGGTAWRASAAELDRLIQRRLAAIHNRITAHLIVAAVLLSTTLALVIVVAGSIATPISVLATLARRVRATNDYTLRAEWRSRDELGSLVETFNDMLARIHAENRREQELIGRTSAAEAQRALIDNIPVPLIVWCGDDQQLLHVNRAAGDLLGLHVGEGDGLRRWMLPADRERLLVAIERHGSVSEFTATCRDAAGEHLWTILSALEIMFQNRRAVLATVTPINERRRIEAELRAAKDEAERAVLELRQTQRNLVQVEKLASLGSLVAGVAHEINTPVGIGLTGASLLGEETDRLRQLYDAGEMTEDAFAEFLSVVSETGQILVSNMNRAGALIQSFKQVAVDQTGAERRVFALSAYLREIIQTLGPRLKGRPVEIAIECADTLEIDGYPGALAQVITNLVLNALIHAFDVDQVGSIRIVVDQPAAPDSVRLRVGDDGKGIAAEHLGRVFDPFFTTRRASGGSGLGLHVVYNLVNGALQGHIDVASTPLQGTIFTIEFPRVVKIV